MAASLTGLLAAAFTPMHEDTSLNLELVEPYARHLEASGVTGVFVAGTTGEAPSLSFQERRDLATRWIEAGHAHNLKVVIQVGHNCQWEACALAQQASRFGADAIAAHAPTFFKPANAEQLVDFVAPIAAAADDLPFYFYDLPSFTCVSLPMVDFLRLGKPRMPNLRGLKYSHLDMVGLQQCLALDGDFEVLFGIDEALLAALVLGVRGAIGSNYNFAAPLYLRILKAFEAGDLETARREQSKAVALVKQVASYGFIPAAKTLMSRLGLDCGPVRPPLRPLDVEQLRQLQESVALE